MPNTYLFTDIEFLGAIFVSSKLHANVRIETSQFQQTVNLHQCELKTFTISNSKLAGDLVVEDCTFNGPSRFDHTDFESDVRFHLTRLQRRPSFTGSVIQGRTEFLECEFGIRDPTRMSTSFSDVIFKSPAVFNKSIFHTSAKFQSTVFESDASFLNVHMNSGATFRNVHFNGDVEFRFCQISTADFGNQENLTVFSQRADFRGCTINTGIFNYVDFRGETSFVNSSFGAGGASFLHTSFGNKITHFDGLSSSGPLVFTNAHIPNIHFHWNELREPVLAAGPDTKVLAALNSRVDAIGDTESKLDASYYLSKRKFSESISAPLPPMSNLSALIDAIGQRLIAYSEWLLWGWPSGYGTKLGRVLLLAVACWLLSALPATFSTNVLIRYTTDGNNKEDNKASKNKRIYDPFVLEDLPQELQFPKTLVSRLALALGFSFRVLFKVGPVNIHYVVSRSVPERPFPWRSYFIFLWYFGSGLLLLMTLTLANTSPVINKLIGEVLT